MSKIYYNLNETDYIVETENFRYFFSSMLYLTKFVERYIENREEMKYKLSSRYNIELHAPDYFDIILYEKIEKRGFRLERLKGGKFSCLKEIILNGEIKTLEKFNESSKILTLK